MGIGSWAFRLARSRKSVFDKGVVGIAVEPAFTAFSRRDDWMPARSRVLRRVVVRRAVTAQRGPAALTGPQMNPLGVNLDALLAGGTLRMLDGGDVCNVLARLRCGHDVFL